MGKTPRKPTQTPFRSHETHNEWLRTRTRTPAVEGERLTDCATRPPIIIIGIIVIIIIIIIIIRPTSISI